MFQFNSMLKRELSGYFSTPLAYIFIVIFLILSSVFTFYQGRFFERGQADLLAFFEFHPWLYLFLVPAIAMRLWSEERKSGTIELLMTLPVRQFTIVLAKFFAAWCFVGIALMLTFPIWIVVNYLGQPDNGAIITGYLGSWLMAGGFIAIGSCMSAATKNQVIAFILSAVACFLFIVSGFPMVLDAFIKWAPASLVDIISSLSFLSHYSDIAKGVIDFRDIVYFVNVILCWLIATVIIIDLKKAD